MYRALYWSSIFLVLLFSWEVSAKKPDASVRYPLSDLLESTFDNRIFKESDVALHVVNMRTKEELFAHEADTPLIAASVTKALTAATALRTLGSTFRFETGVYRVGEVENGVLKGDLYVKGGGDPSLEVHHLWKIAHDLRANGISSIEGNVYYDNSLFDGDNLLYGWNKAVDIANGPAYFPMTSALSVNFNCVAIRVKAAKKAGEKAEVFIEYPSSDITIDNEVKTGKTYARPRLKLSRSYKDHDLKFKLEGIIPLEKEWTYYRTVHEPSRYFISQFQEVLAQNKIDVTGSHSTKDLPTDAVLVYTYRSPHLHSLISKMNKNSLNLYAEHIYLMLGVHQQSNSNVVVEDYLRELGVFSNGTVLKNGSGLSRSLKLSASTISAVFSDMYDSRLVGPEFKSSLSIGGIDGTLRRRFADPIYAGKLRGKTGSLNYVYCLGTFVQGYDGDTYAVVILINNLKVGYSKARELQNEILGYLLDGVTKKTETE
ncbi:MAG: D-alanyl-D-alanine carboxypeptidase/D-alanyl-D-alanine-endopeptidase [Myxococcota bacterium]|nr:D-alanyl-D-alanine carboxypeptidase/D-alanyl-D-alanine-endopeptidase [Myxococcota bacterium]